MTARVRTVAHDPGPLREPEPPAGAGGSAPRRAGWLAALLLATGLFPVLGSGAPSVPATPGAGSEPLLTTGEGAALRVGPPGAEHAVGLLANGAGAIGIAVAADGAFLAFTCGMRTNPDAWYSGDWYRGTLAGHRPAEATGPDGERLQLARTPDGRLAGLLTSAAGDTLTISAAAAVDGDGLHRRDDADGVLGAVALPGNAVCAVKRTGDGRFLPAGTVPY